MRPFRSFVLLAFLTLPFSVISAAGQSLSGLGIEMGGSYGQLFEQQFSGMEHRVEGDFTRFSIRPAVRVSYLTDYSGALQLMPFLGYSQVGGRDHTLHATYGQADVPEGTTRTEIWYSTVEAGMYVLPQLGPFQLGGAAKLNMHPTAREGEYLRSEGSWHGTGAEPRDHNPYSLDLGLRAGLEMRHVSLAAEAWLGMSNLFLEDMPGSVGSSRYRYAFRQNNFRMLAGYRF